MGNIHVPGAWYRSRDHDWSSLYQRQIDFAQFGAEMQKLGQDLGQPAASMHH